METQPILYLALHSLRTLAKDVENMSSGLLHVIRALETSLSPPVTNTSEDQFGELLKRFDDVQASLGQLSVRMETIESRVATITKAEPPPVSEPVNNRNEAKQASKTVVPSPPLPSARVEAVESRVATITKSEPSPDSKPEDSQNEAQQNDNTTERKYPLNIRKMAVDMKKRGEGTDAIILAIHKGCGYAPGKNSLPIIVNLWEKELDSTTKPLVPEAVSASNSVVAGDMSDSGDIGGSPQVSISSAETNGKTLQLYPPEVKKLAVDMMREGKRFKDIILAIQKECGYAPAMVNLSTLLNRWEREMNSSSKPQTRDVLQPSIAAVAISDTSLDIGKPSSPAVAQYKPLPDSGNAGNDFQQASTATVAPDERTSRVDYPPEVRRMVVDLKRKGESLDAIISAIHGKCGYAPSKNNLPKMLNVWEMELDSPYEPVAQNAVPVSSAIDVSRNPEDLIEANSTVVIQDELALANVAAEKDATLADAATAESDKNPLRTYPPDVRKMAVKMRREGKKLVDIIAAIHKECGYSPSKGNLSSYLKRWEKRVDSLGEPLVHGAVASSSALITISDTPSEDGKASSAPVAQAELPPANVDAGKDAPQADAATAAPDKKTSRLTFPPDVRRMAVDMRRKGKSNDAIISAIQKKCGYAPDRKFLTNYLNRWENPR